MIRKGKTMTEKKTRSGQAADLRKRAEEISREKAARKQAEQMQQESEERYRRIFETTLEGIYQTTPQGRYLRVNPAFALMLGYASPEDLVGSITDIGTQVYVNPDRRFEFKRHLSEHGRVENFEAPLYRKDGTTMWGLINAVTVRNENGDILYFTGGMMDITDRKRTEEALRRSETNYRSVIENIQDVFYRSDAQGDLIMVSPSYATLLGFESLDDCLDKSIAGTIYYDPEKRTELLRELQGKGSVTNYEVVLKRRDGTPVTVETNSHIYFDDAGNIAGVEGIFRDMTEHKRAAESLRESEEKFRSVVEKSSVGIAIVDDTFLCTYVNKECCDISGYSEQEILGKNFTFLLAEESKLLAAERYQRRQRGEDVPAQYEFSFVQKTGQKRIGDVRSAVYLDSSGKVNSLVQVMDITERKQAEKKLQQTLDSLRKAFSTTIQVLVSAVETRDPYTSGHQIRSADLARAIATEMGLLQEKIDGIRMAGSIHDIVKLSIPAEILSKPTKLTNIEFSLIKEHARRGFEMLKDVESPWPLAEIVYQHHERMDGSGYPRNLKGVEILIEARIMAVADVVESMASYRPYRPALGLNAALKEIENNKGTLYDADAVDACLRLFREKGYQLERTGL